MSKHEISLPDIGEGVTEGELVSWLVKVGDDVTEDQPVAEVMTDKATVEVPSPFSGKVIELKVSEGDIIPIGGPMVVLDGGGALAPSLEKPAPAVARPPSQPTQRNTSNAEAQASRSAASINTNGSGLEIYPPVADNSVLATPATRRLAREMGININSVTGTGPVGRVTREDVLKSTGAVPAGAPTFAKSPSSSAPKFPVTSAGASRQGIEERIPLRGIRRKIAESMQLAKRIVPHFTIMDEANVTELVKMRSQVKAAAEKQGIKVTYLPIVMKALIATIREFPMINASIDDEAQEIVYKKYFNIGFAADTPNGLLVPVIKDADQKTIFDLSREIVTLAGNAREGKLALENMKGATITITNIGSIGGTYATPIINHPEVAIFGMYKISDKPIVVDGKLEVAKSMNFTLTADHRLIDGAVAANVLRAFISRIENPSLLMMEMM